MLPLQVNIFYLQIFASLFAEIKIQRGVDLAITEVTVDERKELSVKQMLSLFYHVRNITFCTQSGTYYALLGLRW